MAPAEDTNDPMTPAKGCWSVNLAPDDPFYVGQREWVLPRYFHLKMTVCPPFYLLHLKMTPDGSAAPRLWDFSIRKAFLSHFSTNE